MTSGNKNSPNYQVCKQSYYDSDSNSPNPAKGVGTCMKLYSFSTAIHGGPMESISQVYWNSRPVLRKVIKLFRILAVSPQITSWP